jgi:hypothetical protein
MISLCISHSSGLPHTPVTSNGGVEGVYIAYGIGIHRADAPTACLFWVPSDGPMLCFSGASVYLVLLSVPSAILDRWHNPSDPPSDGASVHPVLKTPRPKPLYIELTYASDEPMLNRRFIQFWRPLTQNLTVLILQSIGETDGQTNQTVGSSGVCCLCCFIAANHSTHLEIGASVHLTVQLDYAFLCSVPIHMALAPTLLLSYLNQFIWRLHRRCFSHILNVYWRNNWHYSFLNLRISSSFLTAFVATIAPSVALDGWSRKSTFPNYYTDGLAASYFRWNYYSKLLLNRRRRCLAHRINNIQ